MNILHHNSGVFNGWFSMTNGGIDYDRFHLFFRLREFYKLFLIILQMVPSFLVNCSFLEEIMRASHLLQMSRSDVLVSPGRPNIFMPHHGLDKFQSSVLADMMGGKTSAQGVRGDVL